MEGEREIDPYTQVQLPTLPYLLYAQEVVTHFITQLTIKKWSILLGRTVLYFIPYFQIKSIR